MTWRQLKVLLRGLPVDAALARAIHGEAAMWTLTDHLLAVAVDALNSGNWQRGNAGARTPSRRPAPLPRPGISNGERHVTSGRTSMSIEQAREIMTRLNRRQEVTDDG
jgi:thiosulfate reductase cytochrome b subunit